ncbi:uncharacterized protein LOC103146684 [Poecilia formosa]|uniref:uncharacterized protein LOC103146684 n=1 Tax=Poecilia formosa TaxID=48698 RepID=UPI0007BACD61|nr:PREDICTED: uncharacterized protein LOC103146684 [Poecilia formosa]
MHRGLRSDKKKGSIQPLCEEEEEEAVGVTEGMEEQQMEPTLSDLMVMLQTHMGQQDVRDAKQSEVNARQEQRFKALQHQFNLLQSEIGQRSQLDPPAAGSDNQPSTSAQQAEAISASPSPTALSPTASSAIRFSPQMEGRLEKLTEDDDIEHFLVTFERMAAAYRWQKADWVFRLIPLLTGRARGAYVHMNIDDSLDYDKVKSAILLKYDINPESYRQKFRSLEVKPDESPRELYARLKELYGKWIQPRGKTVHDISEIIILEQFLRMLSPELQVWIREHNPESARRAAELADVFVAARKKGQVWSHNMWKSSRDVRRTPQPHLEAANITASKPPQLQDHPSTNMSKVSGKRIVCYLCGLEGHTKPRCPRKSTKMVQMCSGPRAKVNTDLQGDKTIKMSRVEVDGIELMALLDSGSSRSLVHADFVPFNVRTYDTISICCVHGDEKSYPTADMHIKVKDQMYLMNVGVVSGLPYSVVLGRDFPVLFALLEADQIQESNLAVTRAQVKRADTHSDMLSALPFFNEELETAAVKPRRTRRQKRRERLQFSSVDAPMDTEPALPPFGFDIPSDIGELQKADQSLSPLFQMAKLKKPGVELDLKGEEYILQNDILYHQQGSLLQLVVPQQVRSAIITLGHSIPWAGHLGKHKTTARIKQQFYWPGLSKDVAQFCKSCPECQMTSAKIPPKAPLQPLPVIGVPFERLGMDIVGPVERSTAGNRYMLVVTDYATKYPEVFPLKSIKARPIASCLVQLFARVGFPREILTDQGTNFMSTLLVLLPSDDSKLLAKWQGPYEVVRKIGPATYEVSTPGQLRPSRALHINLLKEWVQRVEHKADALLIRRVAEEDEVEEQYLPPSASLDLDLGHLPQDKQQQFSSRAALLTDMTGTRSPNNMQWTEEAVAAFYDIQQSLMEKEMLAIKWALDSFRYYLLGRDFTLETDHKALQWLKKMKDTNGRITRLYLALQPFQFTVRHIPGKENITADYLSRCISESPEEGGCVMASHTGCQRKCQYEVPKSAKVSDNTDS